MPTPNNKKTLVFGEIDIFFNAKVGILLTNNIAIKPVRNGVIFLISIPVSYFIYNNQSKKYTNKTTEENHEDVL